MLFLLLLLTGPNMVTHWSRIIELHIDYVVSVVQSTSDPVFGWQVEVQ